MKVSANFLMLGSREGGGREAITLADSAREGRLTITMSCKEIMLLFLISADVPTHDDNGIICCDTCH